MNALDEILKYKKELLSSQRAGNGGYKSLDDLKSLVKDVEPPLPFLKNFKGSDVNIIAEVKKASPSKGIIREDFNAVDIARVYEENGAKALSVLTEENFFLGSLDYLKEIKKNVSIPVLRKDFNIDVYHVYEARANNADSLLLIAGMIEKNLLEDLYGLARELGMTPLVEVHNEEDLRDAVEIKSIIIGINNRNLKTFKTDLNTTRDLLPKIPLDTAVISESGINTKEDIDELMETGVSGFLIGESLMREKDFGGKLKSLIN